MRDKVDVETGIEAGGTNVSGVDDGTINTNDGDGSRKLFRAMEVLDIIGAGEGGTGI